MSSDSVHAKKKSVNESNSYLLDVRHSYRLSFEYESMSRLYIRPFVSFFGTCKLEAGLGTRKQRQDQRRRRKALWLTCCAVRQGRVAFGESTTVYCVHTIYGFRGTTAMHGSRSIGDDDGECWDP